MSITPLNRNAVWETVLMSYIGLHDQAVEISRHLAELTPGNAVMRFLLGMRLLEAGDLTGASAAMADAIRLQPGGFLFHSAASQIELAKGNVDLARAFAETARQLRKTFNLPVGSGEIYILNRAGLADEASDAFKELTTLAETNEIGAGHWAMAYLGIRDYPQTIRWLEEVAEKIERREADLGFAAINMIRNNDINDPVLEQPEFVKLRRRLAPPFEL
jgi:predicted Zn-dependent protease